ncbi:MAG: YoaK family protein [Methanomassiliicoccus sp.]|nr:YoaK family protein [Methanomassiliicoccus sp.]
MAAAAALLVAAHRRLGEKKGPFVSVTERQRDRFLLMLACAAGGMDALSLLGLGGVLTSALSGNTILLGIAIVQGHLEEAVLCSVVFLGFVPGAILGAMFLRSTSKGSQWTSRVTASLAVESAALLALALGLLLIDDTATIVSLAVLVVLSAFAMGIQYMTMFRLNVKGVTTTFVTSTIVNLACRLALPEQFEREKNRAAREEDMTDASCLSDRTKLFLGLVWGAYFTGAVISASLIMVGRTVAAAFPFVLVFTIVCIAWPKGYRQGPTGRT